MVVIFDTLDVELISGSNIRVFCFKSKVSGLKLVYFGFGFKHGGI